jgi:hypothetical protein
MRDCVRNLYRIMINVYVDTCVSCGGTSKLNKKMGGTQGLGLLIRTSQCSSS